MRMATTRAERTSSNGSHEGAAPADRASSTRSRSTGAWSAVRGLLVEVAGPIARHVGSARASMIETGSGDAMPCEVVGFSGRTALRCRSAPLEGVRRGCRAHVTSAAAAVRPSAGLARPRRRCAWASRSTARGRCRSGPSPYPFRSAPPPAHARQRVGAPLDLGVRAHQHLPHLPAAASAWASSRAPASASRCCCRCWRATPRPTSR